MKRMLQSFGAVCDDSFSSDLLRFVLVQSWRAFVAPIITTKTGTVFTIRWLFPMGQLSHSRSLYSAHAHIHCIKYIHRSVENQMTWIPNLNRLKRRRGVTFVLFGTSVEREASTNEPEIVFPSGGLDRFPLIGNVDWVANIGAGFLDSDPN
ncbi:hypothetical protein BC936DRAFT_142647 [Jimgerdemannia flammicorona]|uniref:Uncharacterized protein n=1 Tax=Jimgerdemannia flammicorona TaxID=994334 RepID=A0A433A0J7_9FUNG|nr:hypothetical protein BC936DRAFT_142647 [Jimgerdemannia flammicorona]